MKQNNNQYGGVILAIILCILWMVVTGIIGALGVYEVPRNITHFLLYFTVLAPTVFFVILFALIPSVRQWTQGLSLAMLTLPHAWRTVGFTFLTVWAFGVLPASFAAPAGFGDFAIGIAAPFVVVALWLKWTHAIKATVWMHTLGLIDLTVAIYIGSTGFLVPEGQMSLIDPMSRFPLVVIPTVFVPLLVLSHVMVFVILVMDKRKSKRSTMDISS